MENVAAVTRTDIHEAARIARVSFDVTTHGSRKRDHAFEVHLTGESRRRPGHSSAESGEYAATWDQWGVFLAHLFAIDPQMTCYAYKDAEDYATKTADRFGAPEVVMTSEGYAEQFIAYGWPEDAHGDHTFRYAGTHGEQSCTKCSAVQHWEVAA